MRRRRVPISGINVVPYLDVLLVLLVIFMVTAPLFNVGEVEVPRVGEKPLSERQQAALEVIYTESEDNPYHLIDHREDQRSDNLNEEALIKILRTKKILYRDPRLIISADASLRYKEVMALLGVLRDAGFDKIALSARSSAQK